MLKWAHYARKLDIGLLCPNMEIQPRAPNMEFFKIFLRLKTINKNKYNVTLITNNLSKL